MVGALAGLVLACVLPGSGEPEGLDRSRIRLVLQITVDGLRADLLDRDRDRFGEGGFRRLLENGVVYRDAHYGHANTETIVGHATLASGADPSAHGLVGNVWFDREDGELAYNIGDPDHPLVPALPASSHTAQVDPAQRRARTSGRSPRALLVTTFADELHTLTRGRSRIVAIAGKDRSAVSMAGHAGKAFWLSTQTGGFVTSRYYVDELPGWVAGWNARQRARSYAGTRWTLAEDPSRYRLIEADDRPYEVDLGGYGRVFPHPFGEADHPLFTTRLLVSPVGDTFVLELAKEAVLAEGMGQDEVPDYLSLSFSSVDAVNHFFGPSSLENEDVLRHLDGTLAALFAFLDEQVGLEHTLIVLSADHGMPEMPEAMAEAGFRAGRLTSADVVERADAAARSVGVDGATAFFYRPSLYLDHERIAAAGVDPKLVARAIANALTASEGISLAVAMDDLSILEDTDLVRRIRRNRHPTRSGDVYVVQAPYWFLLERGSIAVMHGSPWRYDTHVPIVVAGPGVPALVVDRRVEPVDVAPTLSRAVGAKTPSASVGRLLEEVFGGRP